MAFPIFDKKEDIPKGFESEYEEKEGKFVAKVPDVSKLEETLSTVRTEKKAEEKKAREATDRAADLQRKLDTKTTSGADDEKRTGEMLARWEKDKNDAVKTVQDQLDAANARLREVTLYDIARAEFIKAGGRPEKADAALKLKKDSLDLVDDRPVVKDEKGNVTTETLPDFWSKKFKAEMPEFFTGTKASGGGAAGGAGKNVATGDPSAAEKVMKNPLAALQEANAEALEAA